jgi:hypothetical protein
MNSHRFSGRDESALANRQVNPRIRALTTTTLCLTLVGTVRLESALPPGSLKKSERNSAIETWPS